MKQAPQDSDSVLYTYQQLIALRKRWPVIVFGDYQDLAPQYPHLWCYQREWEGTKLLVMANMSVLPLQLAQAFLVDKAHWKLLYSNYGHVYHSINGQSEAAWWLPEA